MSAATVITSAMPNVPVLSGTEGSLAALIRYIAPILGWEIMFDNGPVIVVRPQSYKGGQPLLYRFDDRAARGGAAPRIAEVRAYESMSDIDTGAGLVGPVYIHKSYTSDTASRRYYIIADQYGMLLATPHVNQWVYTVAQGHAYLGFLNAYSDEIPVCSLFGNGDADSSFGYMVYQPEITASSKAFCFEHKNRSGQVNIPVAVFCPAYQRSNYAFGNANDTTAYPAYVPGNECAIGRPFVNDGSVYTCRGEIPGMRVLFCSEQSIAANFQDMSVAPSVITPTILGAGEFVRTYSRGRNVGSDCDAQSLIWDIGQGFRV